jgi:hypothetical protein
MVDNQISSRLRLFALPSSQPLGCCPRFPERQQPTTDVCGHFIPRPAAPLAPIKPRLPWHGTVSTHLEDKLAFEMTRLAQPMCVAGLRQTIGRDLRSAYRSRLKQLGDSIKVSAGASNRRPERLYIVAIGLWRLWAGSGCVVCQTERSTDRTPSLRSNNGYILKLQRSNFDDTASAGADLRRPQ